MPTMHNNINEQGTLFDFLECRLEFAPSFSHEYWYNTQFPKRGLTVVLLSHQLVLRSMPSSSRTGFTSDAVSKDPFSLRWMATPRAFLWSRLTSDAVKGHGATRRRIPRESAELCHPQKIYFEGMVKGKAPRSPTGLPHIIFHTNKTHSIRLLGRRSSREAHQSMLEHKIRS